MSEQAVVQGTVETREGLTIYTRIGDWPMVLLGLALVLAARLTPRAGSWWGRRSRG